MLLDRCQGKSAMMCFAMLSSACFRYICLVFSFTHRFSKVKNLLYLIFLYPFHHKQHKCAFNHYTVKTSFVGLANDAPVSEFMLSTRAPQSDAVCEQQQVSHTGYTHTSGRHQMLPLLWSCLKLVRGQTNKHKLSGKCTK